MNAWFSIRKETDKYIWILFAGNCHEVLRSKRSYNQAHHARDAARRLFKIVSNASFTYGQQGELHLYTKLTGVIE